MEKTYEVKGMTCVICKGNVEKALKNTEGVSDCKVNLLENEALVTFDEGRVSEEKLAKAVADAGYELVIHKNSGPDIGKIVMYVSVILVLILMVFSMGHMFGLHIPEYGRYVQWILCTVVLVLNGHYYRSGFRSLFHLSPNMDSLVSLSSSVSYIYSLYVLFSSSHHYHLYFETAAMI
ncbi:MAG: cation-translocating P-type ATPase, partial [Erysipelotrichaceae bacterium]|nr:cation-translocating P-type ATPase [Erysipelotrichaceae bacterium]